MNLVRPSSLWWFGLVKREDQVYMVTVQILTLWALETEKGVKRLELVNSVELDLMKELVQDHMWKPSNLCKMKMIMVAAGTLVLTKRQQTSCFIIND